MDNKQRLFDLIGELARRRHRIAERDFAALGLDHTEARLLTLLDRAGGVAAQDALSSQMLLDRSNAGRALSRLEQAGYVERRKGDLDKRTNLVRMTAKGQAAVVEIARLRVAMADRFFGDLGDDEAGTIVALLRRVVGGDDHA
jgi:DNA-binding MarR family transcriptional regulator